MSVLEFDPLLLERFPDYKLIAMATCDDITDLYGADQLCSGLNSGIEGSIHAMRELYEENHSAGWRLLLVDARNTFNSLNRAAAALWNSRTQWPRCSRFLFNTYRGYPSLILKGSTKSEAIYSKEGVGQGDPLSMLMYASALMPLIQSLSNPTTWIQNWYADDSSCTAKLTDLHGCFDKLCDLGPTMDIIQSQRSVSLLFMQNMKPKPSQCFNIWVLRL